MPAEGWEWFEVNLKLPRYRLGLTLSSQWASYLEYVLVPVEGEENMFHVVIKVNHPMLIFCSLSSF